MSIRLISRIEMVKEDPLDPVDIHTFSNATYLLQVQPFKFYLHFPSLTLPIHFASKTLPTFDRLNFTYI